MTENKSEVTPTNKRQMTAHTRILLGLTVGAFSGIAVSLIFDAKEPTILWIVKNITQPLGNLWLRLLLMIVIPLVFSALVIGVAGLGDLRKLGRVGIKTLLYTLSISAISVVIALCLVNLVEPGKHINPEVAKSLQAEYGATADEKVSTAETSVAKIKEDNVPVLTQIIDRLVPENPLASMAGEHPNLLHIMFFALILGMAAATVEKTVIAPFLGLCEGLYEVSVTIINWIMYLAPYAVAFLVFSSIASFGMELLVALLWFVAVVLGGLLIQVLVVYSASVYFLSDLSPPDFFRRVKLVAITAFSTSSSNATLPTALYETKEKLGVPEEINSFVLTIGATANQNGTAIYEGITILFLAQLAGVDLSLGAQLGVAYMAILGGIGTAGVPGGSIPYIIVVLASVGVDPALIGIILGVDRLLDMCRTAINVVGDITAATYIARSEGYTLKGQLSKGS